MGFVRKAMERWRQLLKRLGSRGRVGDKVRMGSTRARRIFAAAFGDRLWLAKGSLLVVLLGLLAIFVYDMLLGREIEVPPLGTETDRAGLAPGREQEGKPLSYYSGAVAGKDLFRASPRAAAGGGTPRSAREETVKKLENLELQGIFLDEKPQVVIEDKEAGKTHFLYEGDTLHGMVVEKILKGKVILKYQDEHLELVL
jgi:hypothetical protein